MVLRADRGVGSASPNFAVISKLNFSIYFFSLLFSVTFFFSHSHEYVIFSFSDLFVNFLKIMNAVAVFLLVFCDGFFFFLARLCYDALFFPYSIIFHTQKTHTGLV